MSDEKFKCCGTCHWWHQKIKGWSFSSGSCRWPFDGGSLPQLPDWAALSDATSVTRCQFMLGGQECEAYADRTEGDPAISFPVFAAAEIAKEERRVK